jgi:hypothetical protein
VSDGSAPVMANRLMYGGALLVTTTALGAIALQAKQIVAGKDPIDMRGDHAVKFWLKAVAQGGGLSIVGDMLLNDPGNSTSDAVRGMAGTAMGPAASTAAQAAWHRHRERAQGGKGKETHAAAETVNLVRQNAPFVNLWYAKAALDHAGMHALQENLSPATCRACSSARRKEWGQQFWWGRAPARRSARRIIGKAVGQ